ncbi:hypothetical protein MHEL_60520 [Mycolicibacterium helvum]|uniref:Rieske domain-containing protein n=1 Tax=Mycolicibacterium helvum TaxID=1534349 RepID=A0A7I7THF7_9MYCO|nr:hypothetical protein MHEL_60520 [Mycolicibacterium helvum]
MKNVPLQVIPKADWPRQRPTYADAKPAVIEAALRRAEDRPSGNWYVFAASIDIRTDRPFGARVGGLEVVAWRDQQRQLHVGPAACPHLGADLTTGKVNCGGLICPWHGLRLDGGRSTAGSRCRLSTTVCWRGSGSTMSGVSRHWIRPSCRPGPPARGWPRWLGSKGCANRAT